MLVVVLSLLVSAVLTAGCIGIGNQQPSTETSSQATSTPTPSQGTSTYTSDWRLVITDQYPNRFNVSVENASTGEQVAHRRFNSTDHGRTNISAMIPRHSVAVVTITSNDEVLWEERMAPSVSYELLLREDGTVEESIYEA
jgi:hypothetical protein